jgi:hypothetical protein
MVTQVRTLPTGRAVSSWSPRKVLLLAPGGHDLAREDLDRAAVVRRRMVERHGRLMVGQHEAGDPRVTMVGV